MRVAIDTNALYTGQAGIARHVRGLLRGLDGLSPPQNYFPLAWEVENFAYRQPARALKTIYRELIWGKVGAPRRLKNEGAELYHGTGSHFVSVPTSLRCVVTLHDLAMFRYPERFRKWQRWSDARRARSLHKVDRIICVSQFTADEAMNFLSIPAAKLCVVHNGCDFHPEESCFADQKPEFEVPPEFFLFVGSLEPGKNLSLLKESYRLAEGRGKALAPLLIVGARWAGVPGEGPPPKGWHYLGRQSDAVLVYLYRHALGLIFPTKYEGFGFPLVEAMSLGCPVVCSPVASLPEVGGQSVFWSQLTAGGYLEAMVKVQNDRFIREDLSLKGRNHALRFSWQKCAEATSSIYREVCR